MSTSPIDAYNAAVLKIEEMFEDMKQLLIKGVVKTPNGDGMLQCNRDEAREILDELIEFIKTPDTGYTVFDSYITNLMGVRFLSNGQVFFAWVNYGRTPGLTHSDIPWIDLFVNSIENRTEPTSATIDCQIPPIVDSLKCLNCPSDYDLSKLPCGDFCPTHTHIYSAFGAAIALIESINYMSRNDQKLDELFDETRQLRQRNIQLLDELKKTQSIFGKKLEVRTAQIDEDRLEIQQLKFKLDSVERKFAPELIEYDYDEISSRIDPIRDELKMTQRIFTRLLRNRHSVPFAIAVPLK